MSDENGYSAVEDAPDSEDDEDDHVLRAEEEHMGTYRQQTAAHSSPRPSHQSGDSFQTLDHGPPADDGSEDADEEDAMDDDHEVDSSELGDNLVSSGESAAPLVLTDEAFAQSADRHAHYPVPDTDTEFTTDDDRYSTLFPDIFFPQDSLDPGFRREVEQSDRDADSYSSDWQSLVSYDDFSFLPFGIRDDGNQQDSTGVAQSNEDSALQAPGGLYGDNPYNALFAAFPHAADAPADDDDKTLDGYECKFPAICLCCSKS